jgi:hypothetical protein
MNTRAVSMACALGSVLLVGSAWLGNRAHAQADGPVTKINAEAAASNLKLQSLRGDVSAMTGPGR